MKLIRSKKVIQFRQQVADIAKVAMCTIMPEIEGREFRLDDTVRRVSLGFQEELGSPTGQHVHQDLVLTNWPGTWGTFCIILLDWAEARLRIWGKRPFVVEMADLDTREGRADLIAAIEDSIENRKYFEHILIEQEKFEKIEGVGSCCHDSILTICYRLRKRSTMPEESWVGRIVNSAVMRAITGQR